MVRENGHYNWSKSVIQTNALFYYLTTHSPHFYPRLHQRQIKQK